MNRAINLSILFICCPAAAQNISTIAGGGPVNIPSLQVGLARPSGVAVDSSGQVYISLAQLHQIWKVNTSGQVNVFAGNGSFPFNRDGIPAASATLYQPCGLAFDSAGNLYVADSGHNRIRKISTAGVISTVAGVGTAGFSGDGSAASAAQLNNPVAIALDAASNLYIADQGNHRIRFVTAAGAISTLAGNGTAAFSGDGGPAAAASLNRPNGVTVDTAGAVYIADSANFRLRKVSAGNISTAAGNGTSGYSGDGGPAASAQLNTITGVAVDPQNNVYIAEATDIRLIAASQTTISTWAGGTTGSYSGDGSRPTTATFQGIAALAIDRSGLNFFIADAGNYRIRKISSNVTTTFAGNGTLDYTVAGSVATSASFLTPNTVAVDNAGTLLFADAGSAAIRKLSLPGGTLSTTAGTGFAGFTPDGGAVAGPVSNPAALVFGTGGTYYFVEGNRIRKVSGGLYGTVGNTANTAGFAGDGGQASAAQFSSPGGLAVTANGDLYVADSKNNRVRFISGTTGVVTTIAGTGAAASTGDGASALAATLNYPVALALDGAGSLYVAELLGNRVRKISLSTNAISTLAGDGTTVFADGGTAAATGVSAPLSLFADQSGNVFIADQGHSRVRKVTAGTNLISTVAGNGAYDFGGDGASATAASTNPLAITVDRSQTLYIADSSGRIRSTIVTACFFSIGNPVVYVNSQGGTGSFPITATNPSCPYSLSSSSPFITFTGGSSGTGSGTVTFTVAPDAGGNRTATVTAGGQTVTVAQAGAIGQYNVGYFQSQGGPLWAFDANGNGLYDGTAGGDKSFAFAGQAGVIAFAGDWNGDGRAKAGYYLNGFWVLDYNGNGTYDGSAGGDKFYAFGGSDPSYIPVVGDWNGDGRTKVGYYRNGFWALDTNGSGSFDAGDGFFGFGGNGAGEIPVVGDWNGDKRSKIGYFFNGAWVLDYNGDGVFGTQDKLYKNFSYAAGDKPVTGDWNGDGRAKIGIYRAGFWVLDYNGNGSYDGTGAGGDKFFGFGGNAGDAPIVGDWNGDGKFKVGTYNAGFWTLDYNGNGTYDGTGTGADRFISFGGAPGNQPLIGRW